MVIERSSRGFADVVFRNRRKRQNGMLERVILHVDGIRFYKNVLIYLKDFLTCRNVYWKNVSDLTKKRKSLSHPECEVLGNSE